MARAQHRVMCDSGILAGHKPEPVSVPNLSTRGQRVVTALSFIVMDQIFVAFKSLLSLSQMSTNDSRACSRRASTPSGGGTSGSESVLDPHSSHEC